MSIEKTAVLLMNVGSPDAPTPKAVNRFLSEFLNDKRVIDLPWLARKILVNGIIVPFRIKKSTALYQRLWTDKGSPLIYISEELKEKLQKQLGNKFEVFIGMRYGNPGYKKALTIIKKEGFKKLIVLPLYPQHALSTTETSFVAVQNEIQKQNINVDIEEVEQFYMNPGFVKAFAIQGKKYNPESYDHVLFSFHGIPNRQDSKSKPKTISNYSYRNACFQTAELIARELNITESQYSVGFQSRLSKNWLTPFSDEIIMEKLKEGNTKILVFAPSFVTDCLETIVEIEMDYKKDFLESGGERLQLVESLNAEDEWVNILKELIINKK
jgi:ferrochelatase